jgi:hypothetical protein
MVCWAVPVRFLFLGHESTFSLHSDPVIDARRDSIAGGSGSVPPPDFAC